MKKYIPHITFLSLLFLIVLIAYLANIAVIGAFTGAISAMITDPLLLLGSVIIGLLTINQWKLVIFSILFAIAFSIYIQMLNSLSNMDFIITMYISRILTVLIIVYIANILRLLFNPNNSSNLTGANNAPPS